MQTLLQTNGSYFHKLVFRLLNSTISKNSGGMVGSSYMFYALYYLDVYVIQSEIESQVKLQVTKFLNGKV
jgi:hypothetical protein